MIAHKIKTRDQLEPLCKKLKEQGKIIGFTSGAFDLLHAGHADYLEKAKALCDVLVVGVNSDESVKKYKGGNRPLLGENYRIKVLAGLEAVDFIFLFSERRNRENIETLRPDIYIKAGDYKPESLTSKEVVESLGGRTELIPLEEDISTTQIINRILELEGSGPERWIEKDQAVHLEKRAAKRAPALFLDRDGTINEEVSYLHEPEKFRLLPGVIEGVKKFQDMGYRIVIITNQPGIGMGYFCKEDFYRVNREMLKSFSDAEILVDKIYFCPHSKSEQCECRKPGQALIERAREELNLDLKSSVIVGDKTSDIETGKRAGMRTVLVSTGFGGKDGEFTAEPEMRAESIKEAARLVLEQERI